ncbi:MarR family transcriptional regulator [uncultured Shimia sp.]|uniref:MarR family winged helix-turn-helix transcriptional regulator n=1 Tax=uncultured Shimia sp. TaxID=573152 RepID=UPI00262BC975|nr:MarR family transcriptional regulator [uncultured Shimia sp.]
MAQPRIFFLIHKAHAALTRASDRRTRQDHGLSMVQQGVLFLLKSGEGATVTDLARTLSLGKSSLSGLIDRMSASGLVRRETDPTDGRGVLVFATPRGREAAQSLAPLVQGANRALLAPFDSAEQEVIGRFLSHVADNAEAIIEDAAQQGRAR